MKKILILTAAFAVFSLSINAQFGKGGLKNLGKTMAKAATDVAGDVAADMAANTVTNNIVVYMDNNNEVLADDNAYTTRLASLVLDKYVNVDGLSLNYKVYNNPEVNILATANGCIRVYSGMMDALTDDELTAVIATQIGHIANKHTRDALMKMASEDNATNATGAQLEKILSFSGEKLGTFVNELLQVPYSEKQTKVADEYAIALLKKNGKDASGLKAALDKFAAMEENDLKATEDETIELSPAYKFVRVNSNNALRASMIAE